MFSAGSVSATLSGNFSPAGFMAFDGAMKRARSSMDDAEKKMTSSGSRMSKAMVGVAKGGALALGAGLLAVGAAAAKSVSLAADFESELSRLQATTGATAAEMKRFKKDAMDAGAATKFSALDAAKAQVELAKGGLAVKDMSGGLKAAVGLAAAGEIDLALAGTTVVNAMKQFKIPGEEAVHVADALATAANTTTADVGHFAMALTQGGAAAKAAGMDLDSTVAILEAFADNSVKGSDAGTSMKAMLTQLAAPTDRQEKAAKALNLQLWDQQGRLKPLPAMAQALDQAFGGLNNKQRLAAASTIAGTDGMRGLLALYSSSPAKMQDYLDGLKEEGTAATVAAEKQDNLRGKIENLKGSLETAAISFGEGMLPALTDGAESLTGTINKVVASGDLEKLGKDFGEGINWIVNAAPKVVDALEMIGEAQKLVSTQLSGMWKLGAAGVDFFLGAVSTALDAITLIGKAINATDVLGIVPDVDTKSLDKLGDGLDAAREKLRNLGKGGDTEVKIKVKGDVSQAEVALKRVQAMKIDKTRVISILASDTDAKSKIAFLRKLGIPAKTAKILADNADAIAKIGSVRAALASVQSKRITIETTRIERVRKTGSASPGADTGRRAAGRGPGGTEIALTGEGRGGELVGNQADGWTWVDRPTLMNLGPQDAVVPSDPAFAGRALGFMFAAMGVPGYAKGKAPKKKAAPKLAIPAAVQFGAVPEDELNASRDTARERYQKRKETVRDLSVDIRAQKAKVDQAKGKGAKATARRKLRELEKDQRRYRDGGDGLASLADMRKQWTELQKQATVLAAYNRDIERLNTLQETDRTRMATAAKTGDAGAWSAAKSRRGGILAQLRAMYAKAVKLAKPGSLFAAELSGKLAGVEGEIADVAAEELTPAESLFEGGLSKAERDQLANLEAAQALASLTAGTEDDLATAVQTEGFLSAMLGQALRDPSRGGATAIRDLAGQVASARANVASFSGGGVTANENADVQAQLEQQRAANVVLKRESEINRLGLATFQGAGDIGMGGPRIVINTLHPGDPDTLRAIGDAAVGGMSLQGFVSSPRTDLGL